MTFTLFRQLPPELRREIWETALESSSPDKEVCVFAHAKPQPDGALLKPLEVHPAYSPLLATCGESRDIALKSWAAGRRAFDPVQDILYIGGDVFSVFVGKLCFPPGGGGGSGSGGSGGETERETGTETNDNVPAWVSRIRHLALDLCVARAGLWLPLALENLPCLETVAVVFPQAEGTMDVHASAQVPTHAHTKSGRHRHRHVATRVLATRETDAMTIEADYLFETYMGEHPVQWKKSATEYMQEVVSGLRRDVAMNVLDAENNNNNNNNDSNNNVPVCWDKETKQLMLKFEARCFV
ncbi:hypothetical protein SLS62_009957 [Diatrype stigma]|uniref:2EXR domain-containing protein n=1 Tax=Diatrype stigma TaxID=117547 RepID=A0AAN9UCJ3_9PEZI